jgi:oligopeptide transport system substrate-binding protein
MADGIPRSSGFSRRIESPRSALHPRHCFWKVPEVLARFFQIVVVVCFTLLAGCGRSADRAEIVVINGAEPGTIDPAKISGQPEGRVANCLFEGLARYNQKGQSEPGIAERWDISPDGRTYTFHLRDAKWSNGDPITAQDFVWSWLRVLKEPDAEYRYQMYYIRGGEEFAKALDAQKNPDETKIGLRAPDPRTFVVELKNPTPYFIDLCAFYTLAPVHRASIEAAEKTGISWLRPGRLVGTGAFVLKEWRVQDRVRVEKNPLYWDAANVKVSNIDILPVNNPNTAFNFYHSGVADLMLDKSLVPSSLVGDLKKRPDYHAAPILGTYFMRFNVTKKPFDDARVRRALAMVIDKPLLTEKITQAGEVPANAFVPPGTAGYQPPAGLSRDLDGARTLLAEAGFPSGAGFPLVRYLYTNRSDVDDKIAVELQSVFKKELGISINLSKQEWSVYQGSLAGLDYDFARSSWIGDYQDPNTFLDMWVTGGGNNQTGWGNKRYDELIAQAGAETDGKKRFDIFRDAETIALNEAVICPLFNYVVILFFDDKKLGGVQGNLTDEHPFRLLHWKSPR